MATYRDHAAEEKRKRRKTNAKRFFVIVLILVLLLASSYLIMRFINGGTLQQPGSSEVQASSVSVPDNSSSDAQAVPAGSWNSLEPVTRTLNSEVTAPDYRMYALPVNGKVSRAYFDTCMFIGDSITQGMGIYPAALEESAKAGLASVCAYKSTTPKSFLDNATAPDPWGTRVAVWDDLTAHPVPKNIYILLGTNALISMEDDALLHYYGQLLDKIKEYYAPYGCRFYVQVITPVTEATAIQRPRMDNGRIRNLNNYIAQLAVERDMLVIDLNEILTDAAGNLKEDIAYRDGTHLKPEGYAMWLEYLQYHTAYDPANPYEITPDTGVVVSNEPAADSAASGAVS